MSTELLTINYDYLKKCMSHALGFPVASIEGPATAEAGKSFEVEYAPDSICEALDELLEDTVDLDYDAYGGKYGTGFGASVEGALVFAPRFFAKITVEGNEVSVECCVEQGPVQDTDAFVSFFGDEFQEWRNDFDFYGFDFIEYTEEQADEAHRELSDINFELSEDMRGELKVVTFSVAPANLFNEK